MNSNPYEDFLKNIEKHNKETSDIINENKNMLKELNVDLENKIELTNLSDQDQKDYFINLASICFNNIDALTATIRNRMNKNDINTSDAAIFVSILSKEQKETLYRELEEKEKYKINTELDILPVLNKHVIESIIFNIQSEYFLREDGEEPTLDLFKDLF